MDCSLLDQKVGQRSRFKRRLGPLWEEGTFRPLTRKSTVSVISRADSLEIRKDWSPFLQIHYRVTDVSSTGMGFCRASLDKAETA